MNKMLLQSYLKPTEYCDFTHPTIQSLISSFEFKFTTKKDMAVELYYFVRDNVNYRVGFWNKKASETLDTKDGTCTNSANLLVALCRAKGIPSGYGVMRVKGDEYFGPIALDVFKKFVSKHSKHVYCYIYLNDNWLRCDPSDDRKLSINTQHLNKQSTVLTWDGKCDSVLLLDPNHIIEDSGPIANIDSIIKKRQRKILYLPVKLANIYIRFLRENGGRLKEIKWVEKEFILWLQKGHRAYLIIYYILKLIPNFKFLSKKK